MAEILEKHIREYLSSADGETDPVRIDAAEELIEIIHSDLTLTRRLTGSREGLRLLCGEDVRRFDVDQCSKDRDADYARLMLISGKPVVLVPCRARVV